jgi:hypothetical protein
MVELADSSLKQIEMFFNLLMKLLFAKIKYLFKLNTIKFVSILINHKKKRIKEKN